MVDIEEGEVKIGNPWSILPIKNKKYAKDLTEVHLSDRQLVSLEKFDDFPNLEVIWLNNNNVSIHDLLPLLNLNDSFSYETWMTSRLISE